jgi:hypothetical protein
VVKKIRLSSRLAGDTLSEPGRSVGVSGQVYFLSHLVGGQTTQRIIDP